jgi:hypothetical protein
MHQRLLRAQIKKNAAEVRQVYLSLLCMGNFVRTPRLHHRKKGLPFSLKGLRFLSPYESRGLTFPRPYIEPCRRFQIPGDAPDS